MADHTNTLVQCSLKIRHGRKWKTRWCELTKLSPVSDQIFLKFYKGQDQLLSRKEIRHEQIAISAQNFCGVESCIRHPKNPFVLTIICVDQIVLLSFACHNDLLVWFQKTHTALGNAASKYKCTVDIPNGSRLRAGRGLLYFQDNHFAITDDVPSRLIGGWSLADLMRYGLIEEGFAFEVRSTSKNAGAHVVITRQAHCLKSHFDAATYSCTNNRWSHVSSTVSIHEELVPRRRNLVEEMHHLLGTINNEQQSDGCSNNGQGGSNTRNMYSSQVQEFNRRSQSQRSQTLTPHDVEMIELDQSNCLVESGDTSSGSSVETIFNNCEGLRSPKKTTPIREQNYEIMASFSHLRETANSANGNESHVGDTHETCLICHGGKKVPQDDLVLEEHEYVNLPPPKSSKDSKQSSSVNDDNLDRIQVHEPFSERSKQTQTPKFSSNAVHARTKSLPLSDDHVLMKYHENKSSTPATSKTGKARSLSVHPSMERSDSLPRPFEDLLPASTLYVMLQDLPGREKASRERTRSTPSDVPVPFQHGDLVKPVGPLAMLRLGSQSSSSNESVNSVSELAIDARKSRSSSISRPRQSSIGSSYQKAFTKLHSHSQDDQPSTSTFEAETQSRVAGPWEDLELETFTYSRKGSIERRPESPITSAPSVTSYITRRRQSLQRADYSLDETKGRYVEDKAVSNVTRRKRCNTDPSVVFTAKGDATTAWCRDPNDDNEGDADGYLIMKPVYEEKLKRFQSRRQSSSVVQNSMPQSPLHSGEKLTIMQSKLKRSATVSGEVSALSPTRANHRRMSLREQSARAVATPPSDRKGSLSFVERFLRKRGNSEGTVKLDVSRPRHNHNYASIDPENVVRQSQQVRMQSINSSNEVDILSDPEFNECLTRFILEHPPEPGENGSSSAPASMQYNQIDARHSAVVEESDIDAVV